MDKLTPKQLLFVQHYVANHGNGTQAAIDAGYSPDSAQAISSENLSKPMIQREIRGALMLALDQAGVSVERISHELAKIAFADMGDFVSFDTSEVVVGEDAAGNPITHTKQNVYLKPSSQVDTSVIQEVSISKDGTFKFKLYDKHKALDSLAKWQQMYVEKSQVEHSGNIEYVVRFADPDEE